MSSQACYWPDGSVTDSNLVPAEDNQSSGHVACCFTGHYSFANGLCLDISQMTFYRGACTDETWASPACPKYCLDVASQQCGTWACDNSNQFACNPSDCGNQTTMFTVTGAVIRQNAALDSDLSLTTTSATSATSSTPTATSTSMIQTSSMSVTSSSSTTCSAVCSSHVGVYAGLGVGLGVPLIIALMVLVFVIMQLRKLKRTNGMNGNDGYPGHQPLAPNISPSNYYHAGNGYIPQQAAYDQPGQPKTELPSMTSNNHTTAELGS